jgi:dihydropteroate synthase
MLTEHNTCMPANHYLCLYDQQVIFLMDKDTFFSKKRLIRIGGKYLDLSVPKIMGILNITPDSFYDGGKYVKRETLMAQVDKMISDGADIIDIGACSSRPGAVTISEKEELTRLDYALRPIRKKYPGVILSVDTFRSAVVKAVVSEYQVSMVNDISAGLRDKRMTETIAALKLPCIIMHMRGTPADMQMHTDYSDVVTEVIRFLGIRAKLLVSAGITDIIIDPGFGFSKTIDQNYELLENLDAFKILELPILVGISRKSMIFKELEVNAEEALTGTIAANMAALQKGADILRVHDVKEARQTLRLFNKMISSGTK